MENKMENKIKSPHGGKRIKSGRKSTIDKKKAVVVYIKESTISKFGLEFIKDSVKTHINNINK